MNDLGQHVEGRIFRLGRSSRGGVVALLVVLNVALAAILVAGAFRLPAALAQSGLQRGEFICATAKASGFSYDVLYVIDLTDHRLHAFYPGLPKTRRLVNAPSRDLFTDFAKDPGK